MKVDRDCIVLCLCFLFLACGLGLVAAVVSLSPSLGMFNATQVYVPEEIQGGCVNCTIVPISAGHPDCSSMQTFFMLASIAIGIAWVNLA
jgi:hypothetical protein